MKLEHLQVIEDDIQVDDSVGKQLVKDLIDKMPIEDKVGLYNDYMQVNFYAPIYCNTDEVLAQLAKEGKHPVPTFNKDFAFVRPNRYNGVESFNDLSEAADLDEEIVPYAEEHFDDYFLTDSFVEDEPLGTNWLKKRWKKGILGHLERYRFLYSLAKLVGEEDKEAGEALMKVALNYDENPKATDYNKAKKAYFEIMEKFFGAQAEGLAEKDKKKMKEKIYEAYASRYPNAKDYDDLPYSVHNKFKNLFTKKGYARLDEILEKEFAEIEEEVDEDEKGNRLGRELEVDDLIKELDANEAIFKFFEKIKAGKYPSCEKYFNRYYPELTKQFVKGLITEKKFKQWMKALAKNCYETIEPETHVPEDLMKFLKDIEEYGDKLYNKVKGIEEETEDDDMGTIINAVKLFKEQYENAVQLIKDKLSEKKATDWYHKIMRQLIGESTKLFVSHIADFKEFVKGKIKECVEAEQSANSEQSENSEQSPKSKSKEEIEAERKAKAEELGEIMGVN